MAFLRSSLSRASKRNLQNDGGQIWTYNADADVIATVLGANFFDSISKILKTGDLIEINHSTGWTTAKVTVDRTVPDSVSVSQSEVSAEATAALSGIFNSGYHPTLTENLQQSPALTDFSAGHPYTKVSGTGTVSTDTSDFLNGTQSLKVVTAGDGVFEVLDAGFLPNEFDISNSFINLTIKMDVVLNMANMVVRVSGDDFVTAFDFAFNGPTVSFWKDDEWSTLSIGFSDATNGIGTPTDASKKTINRVQIRLADGASTGVTFNLARLSISERPPKAVCSIQFDDTDLTIFTEGKRILSEYGFPATVWIIGASIDDNAAHMTSAQLRELQDLHNWQISCHGFFDLTLLSIAAARADIESNKTFLVNGGFKGAEYYAWPFGTNNLALRELAQEYFLSARATGVGNESFPPSDNMKYRSKNLSNTTTPAFMNALIDDAIDNNDWMLFFNHKLVVSAASTIEYDIADYQTVIDHIATKVKAGVLEVRTIADALDTFDIGISDIQVPGTFVLKVSDDFTESSDTAITSHTPNTGTSWTSEVNDTGNILNVNAAGDFLLWDGDGSSSTKAIFTSQPNPVLADYGTSVKVPLVDFSAGDKFWLVLRFADTSNYYGFGGSAGGGTPNLTIRKRVASSDTILASETVTNLASGDTMKFTVIGSTLTAYLNGVQLLSVVDTSLSAAGQAGIAYGNIFGGTDRPTTGWNVDSYQRWE